MSNVLISFVEQHDGCAATRHQPKDVDFEPTVGCVDCEEGMALAVLPVLAHVEQRNLAGLTQPPPQRDGIDMA